MFLLGALCIWAFLAYKNWHFDDALIVDRIVHNLVHQGEWSYNLGEKLNASTSVLNTLLVAALSVGGFFPVLISSHLVSAVSIFIAGWFLYKNVFKDIPKFLSIGASCAAVLSLSLNSTWGLESNLFIALSLLALSLHPGSISWGLAYGAVILSRPDGALLFAIHFGLTWYSKRKFPILGIIGVFIPLVPWLIFSQITFGSPFPDTLANKVWQGRSGYWGHGYIYLKAIIEHVSNLGAVWLIAIPFSIIGLVGLVRSKSTFLILALFAIAQQSVYVVLNVPGYHWYFTLMDFVAVTLSLHGLCNLVSLVIPHNSAILFPIFVSLFGGVTYLGWSVGERIDSRDQAYKETTNLIKEKGLDVNSIALIEVGTIGFHLMNTKIIDLLGLTSLNPQYITQENLDRFFDSSPSLIVLHEPVWHFESAIYNDLRFRLRYEKIGASGDPPFTTAVYMKRQGEVPSVKEYIDRNYKAFRSVDGDEFLPKNTSTKALCIVDLINGTLATGSEIQSQKGPLTFKGWAVVNGEAKLSENVSIVLTSEGGETFEVPAPRHDRPDVASHLNQPGFGSAGFGIDAHTLGLSEGSYKVSLVQKLGDTGAAERCDLSFRVVIR